MKTSYSRRFSRRSRSAAHAEGAFFRKETADPGFFDAAMPQAFFSAAAPQAIQRKCEQCEDEEKQQAAQQSDKKATMPDQKKQEEEKKKEDGKKVMRQEAGGAPAIADAAPLARPGAETALPPAANRFFSQALGRDFSDVKIHTGPDADRAAKSVRAKAYTLGEHIVFAEGRYDPESSEGKRLLAHELTHVVQQQPARLSRDAAPAEEPMKDMLMGFANLSGSGAKLPPERAFANCAGASVSGFTDANYDHGSYSVSGAAMKQSKGCEGCAEAECVSVSGIIVSTFKASPAVTLPGIPPGNWSDCEKTAIQHFINTTLSQHEQQHVAAFNTYNGTVKTPFSYTGCKDGLDAHVSGIHDGINASREASATAKSDLLDANGANQFTIACDCPDAKPKESDKNAE